MHIDNVPQLTSASLPWTDHALCVYTPHLEMVKKKWHIIYQYSRE